jgi:hypothetical protein
MRITINAFGSRGDVQPYVALGKGLKEAGHDVRLSTHRIFEAFVLEHHLDYFPMEGDPRQVLLTQAVAELGNNPIRVNRWIAENFRPALKCRSGRRPALELSPVLRRMARGRETGHPVDWCLLAAGDANACVS